MITGKRQISLVAEAVDSLAAILVTAKRKIDTGERFFFEVNESELQEAILELQNQFPKSLLDVFIYGDGGPAKWSPVLSEALSHLAVSGWIGRPDRQAPQLLELKPSAEEGFDTMIAPYLAEKGRLDDIAVAFLEKVGVAVR